MKYLPLFVLFLLVACGAPGDSVKPPTQPPTAVEAQFVVGLYGNLVQLDLPSQEQIPLLTLPDGQSARFPELAPDDRQIAFVLQGIVDEPDPEQVFTIPTSVLAVTTLGSQSFEVLYDPSEPLASIINAAWSPDGTRIYATLEEVLTAESDGMFLGYAYTVLEIDVASKTATRLIEDARDPVPSPDGTQLLFVSAVQNETPQLVRYQAGERSIIVSDPQFLSIAAPIWPTPDQIYFAGGIQEEQSSLLPSWLAAGTAQAHGGIWYPWRVAPDGSGLERFPVLAPIDDPRLAVQADKLFVWSFPGLWMYENANPASPPKAVFAPGDVGGLAILP